MDIDSHRKMERNLVNRNASKNKFLDELLGGMPLRQC